MFGWMARMVVGNWYCREFDRDEGMRGRNGWQSGGGGEMWWFEIDTCSTFQSYMAQFGTKLFYFHSLHWNVYGLGLALRDKWIPQPGNEMTVIKGMESEWVQSNTNTIARTYSMMQPPLSLSCLQVHTSAGPGRAPLHIARMHSSATLKFHIFGSKIQ